MASPRYCLYGTKPNGNRKLVALLGSEQQVPAYVSWATLQATPERKRKFERARWWDATEMRQIRLRD